MKLGMQLGLGPGHIVLDGDPDPPFPQGHSLPQFSAHICCGQMAACIKMSLGMELGLGPGDFVLHGDLAPPPKRGEAPQIFGLCLLWPNGWIHQDVTWYGCRRQPWGLCVSWRPSPQHKKGAQPPNFRPMFIVTKRLDA